MDCGVVTTMWNPIRGCPLFGCTTASCPRPTSAKPRAVNYLPLTTPSHPQGLMTASAAMRNHADQSLQIGTAASLPGRTVAALAQWAIAQLCHWLLHDFSLAVAPTPWCTGAMAKPGLHHLNGWTRQEITRCAAPPKSRTRTLNSDGWGDSGDRNNTNMRSCFTLALLPGTRGRRAPGLTL